MHRIFLENSQGINRILRDDDQLVKKIHTFTTFWIMLNGNSGIAEKYHENSDSSSLWIWFYFNRCKPNVFFVNNFFHNICIVDTKFMCHMVELESFPLWIDSEYKKKFHMKLMYMIKLRSSSNHKISQ